MRYLILFIYSISKMRKKNNTKKQLFSKTESILMALPRMRSNWNILKFQKKKANKKRKRKHISNSIFLRILKTKIFNSYQNKKTIFLSKMLIFSSKLMVCRDKQKRKMKIKSYCSLYTYTQIDSHTTSEGEQNKQKIFLHHLMTPFI